MFFNTKNILFICFSLSVRVRHHFIFNSFHFPLWYITDFVLMHKLVEREQKKKMKYFIFMEFKFLYFLFLCVVGDDDDDENCTVCDVIYIYMCSWIKNGLKNKETKK